MSQENLDQVRKLVDRMIDFHRENQSDSLIEMTLTNIRASIMFSLILGERRKETTTKEEQKELLDEVIAIFEYAVPETLKEITVNEN